MFGKYLENVRKRAPLIHNITNFVTVNDVANVLLACGASPIMANDPFEVEEITALSSGLNLNIGTLNHDLVPAMILAGETAHRVGNPVLLDPVGAGASQYRTETARKLVREVKPDVIRGNGTEIRVLESESHGGSRGVDSNLADSVSEENLQETVRRIKRQANRMGCILAVTGSMDLVTDGKICYGVKNGHPEMRRITGTGCMLSGLMTAFLAANPEEQLEAAASAVVTMGLAGEIGWRHMEACDGNATYRNRIIDAVYRMSGDRVDEGEKVLLL